MWKDSVRDYLNQELIHIWERTSISGFAVFVATTQLYPWSAKAATDNAYGLSGRKSIYKRGSRVVAQRAL